MPTSWRIVKRVRAATAFDGEGARLFGGRWNSVGTSMVSTAQRESLAVRIFPSGRVVTVPYGASEGGMTIWAETDTNAQGERVIRFPFDIPLL